MQVSVEKSSGLERRVTVAVPEDQIESEVVSRLQKLTRTVRIDGFRPGRAPLKIVRRRYGKQVRDEVVGEVLRRSLNEAMVDQAFIPAGQPVIDPITAEPGEGLSYTATFEVYPEVALAPIEDLQIVRPVCEIGEEDVSRMVETLRGHHKQWRDVERPADTGDQVTVDFKGQVGGVPFEGGETTDFEVVIGAGVMINGFEDGLRGRSKDADVVLDLRFPEQYRNTELAGKPVRFEIRVKRVAEAVLPELDGVFFEKFGLSEGGLEDFRAEVRRNMERERDDAVQRRFGAEVLTKLGDANEVEIPKALIDSEIARMHQQARNTMRMRGMDPAALEAPAAADLEPAAQKRVKVGLVMAEMIKRAGIKPDPEMVRGAVASMAASYEDPPAVVKWYYDDPRRLREIEARCLEQEAVNWIAQHAQVKDVPTSFDDLMKPRQTENEAGSDLI